MRERVEQVVGFCTDHWKEIGITSIVLHLLVHEVPMLFMIRLELCGAIMPNWCSNNIVNRRSKDKVEAYGAKQPRVRRRTIRCFTPQLGNGITYCLINGVQSGTCNMTDANLELEKLMTAHLLSLVILKVPGLRHWVLL